MSKASPARVSANDRYNKKVYESVALRVRRGTRERWRSSASARGLSLATLIVSAVEEYLTAHPVADAPPPASEEASE